jgi:hypothetical protein
LAAIGVEPLIHPERKGARLFIGPFENRVAAGAACTRLWPASHDCPMIPPGADGRVQ